MHDASWLEGEVGWTQGNRRLWGPLGEMPGVVRLCKVPLGTMSQGWGIGWGPQGEILEGGVRRVLFSG